MSSKSFRINLSPQAILFTGLLFLLFVIGSIAQQQQSGGNGGGTVNQGGAPWTQNLTQISGSALSLGAKTGANSIPVVFPSDASTLPVSISAALPAGANSIGSISNAAFGITGSLPAGTNLLGFVRHVPANTCGTTEYDSGMVFLPNSLTVVTATVTCPVSIFLNNTDSVSHTITITDNSTLCNSGTCTAFGPAYVIPALSQINIPINGAKFVGGIKWNADVINKVVGVVRGNQ